MVQRQESACLACTLLVHVRLQNIEVQGAGHMVRTIASCVLEAQTARSGWVAAAAATVACQMCQFYFSFSLNSFFTLTVGASLFQFRTKIELATNSA